MASKKNENVVQEKNSQIYETKDNNNNYNLIMEIKENLCIDKMNHADVKKIKYDDKINPKKFINDLKWNLEARRIYENDYVYEIDSILTGHAKLWFQKYKYSYVNFEDFKINFLKKFYNEPIQFLFKNKWMNNTCDENMTYEHYFDMQIHEAEYLELDISEKQRNWHIIEQLPLDIQEYLITVDFSKTDNILKSLQQHYMHKLHLND